LLKIEHEIFPSRFCPCSPLLDSLDNPREDFGLDRDLNLDFRQKIYDVFRAAVKLGMALLPAKTFTSSR